MNAVPTAGPSALLRPTPGTRGEGTTRRLPDGSGPAIAVILTAYLLPARLVFPPLAAVGRPAVVLAIVLFLWWSLTRLHPRLAVRGRQPMRWILAGYLATLGASYIAGLARGLPPLEANGADRAMVMAIGGAGLLLILADGVLTRDRVDRVLRWFCWACGFMAMVALGQFALRRDFTTHLNLPPVLVFQRDVIGFDDRGGAGLFRVAGTAGHYIEFSVLMVIGLLVAMHLGRYSPLRRDRQIFTALAVLQAGVIPLSLSRTGVLALGAAVLLLALAWPLRTTLNVMAVGVVVAAAIQVVRPGLLQSLRALLVAGERDPSVRGRTEDYAFVAPYIAERPWFGRGAGTWLPELYQLLDNQWLLTLVTTGWVGVTGLVLLFGGGIMVAGRIRRHAKLTRDRDLALVLAVAVGVTAVSSFTFDSLHFSTYFLTVHLLLGLIGALWRVTRAEPTNEGG
ncbi:O-antigen ligase family protein [Plantactinospora sp. GCM10030261]|uniref:O-antigen ligase family protein n=1 Tax=Plantactinospora sp. GCM10030261 TaxID=3273420 RepID=UPI003617A6C5